MSIITEQHRARYDEIWGIEAYAAFSPGEQFLPLFLDMSGTKMKGSVLDAGCGAGKGALALQRAGFNVALCDITDAGLSEEARHLKFYTTCLWADVKRVTGFYDWVYCCDVLEHVPEAFTMLVVDRLLAVARRGVFLSVCLMPDEFGAFVGGSLHETVHDFVWWRDSLSELTPVIECRDLATNGVYLLKGSAR